MNSNVWVLAVAAAVSFGTPLVFAGLGEILCERSGIVNLGVEGMMLVGAVSAFMAFDHWGNGWLALLCAVLAGGALSLIHAVLCISMRANQTVSGLALVIFGTGVARFIGEDVGGHTINGPFHKLSLFGLDRIPIVGPILFKQDILVYIAVVLAGAVAFYVSRTRSGLALRAVGESPATADAQGISVAGVRYAHVIVGGLFAGLGGGYQVLVRVQAWNQGSTTNGIGWIALALVVFAGWRPYRLVLGAVVFGFALRANFTLQAAQIRVVPPEVLSMAPYLLTIIVLIAVSAGDRRRRYGAPAALGQAFVRDER